MKLTYLDSVTSNKHLVSLSRTRYVMAPPVRIRSVLYFSLVKTLWLLPLIKLTLTGSTTPTIYQLLRDGRQLTEL